MKKNIYLLVLLMSLFSFTSFSQSLTLKKNFTNTPIANDDTITLRYPLSSGIFNAWDSLIVGNISNKTIPVMVKKTYRKIAPGIIHTMCWDVCVDSLTFVAGPLFLLGNNDTLGFTSDYDVQNVTGISIIRFTFYLQNNPTDSICFNIKYIHPENYIGINEINNNYLFSNVYPNPASNFATFNYSFSANVNHANIVVADLLGKEILSIPLSNNEGKATINTKNIANGIYVYSLQLNGRNVNTKKLIINH